MGKFVMLFELFFSLLGARVWPAISSGIVLITYGVAATVSAEPPTSADRNFSSWDANSDGVLTREEVPPGPRRLFDRIDRNGDGQVTLEEHRDGGRRVPPPRTENPGKGRTSLGLVQHSIHQNWAQEPQGFERLYTIKLPDKKTDNWPIVVLLHGNGGEGARMIGSWTTLLPDWLVVAPQGYQRSWNISTERSKAPDVNFIKKMLVDIRRRYPRADRSRVSLIGSSNGAGMVYRLLIELDDSLTIENAIALVSSLTTGQYREGHFWVRSDETSNDYNKPATPVGKRRLLTVHGTTDAVVPYVGGRGPGGTHLSAQQTAYAWAVFQGYEGVAIDDSQGKPCGKNLLRYDYPEVDVTHIKVINGGHGLGPVQADVREIIATMLSTSQEKIQSR